MMNTPSSVPLRTQDCLLQRTIVSPAMGFVFMLRDLNQSRIVPHHSNRDASRLILVTVKQDAFCLNVTSSKLILQFEMHRASSLRALRTNQSTDVLRMLCTHKLTTNLSHKQTRKHTQQPSDKHTQSEQTTTDIH